MIFDSFKKKKKLVVLDKPQKNSCGGTYRTMDKNAPKTIASEKMVLFDITSELNINVIKADHRSQFSYFSAFAAPTDTGSFIFLETRKGHGNEARTISIRSINEDIFPPLVKIVKEAELAKYNGIFTSTAGLPKNFGGAVDIEYESGETIEFSNNRSPVISLETGLLIIDIFSEMMRKVGPVYPDVDSLREIRFLEDRGKKGYTKSFLTINADGTGSNRKIQKFEDPMIFDTVKVIEKETVDRIKHIIEEKCLFAWQTLPEKEHKIGNKEFLTFIFSDDEEITIDNCRSVPYEIRGGFFDIKLEITTKG